VVDVDRTAFVALLQCVIVFMSSNASRIRISPSLLALAFVLSVLGIVVTFRAWNNMYRIANENPEYQHALLVPFVAMVLIWVRRHRLQHCRVTTTVLGPLLVVAGWASMLYGSSQRNDLAFHIGAVVVLVGCVTAALGKQVLFRFFPVAVVLLMMVPLPGRWRSSLAHTLQAYTANISSYVLDLLGIKTQVMGSMMMINNQPVLIAEACNGMRMVLPLMMIAFGFAFAMPLRTSVRLLIVLISPLVALVCNVARVVPLVWLQGQSQTSRDWGTRLHDYSGWVMVPLAFFVLLGLIRVLKWSTMRIWRYPLASQSA